MATLELGLGLFPTEPPSRIVEVAQEAERLGYSHIWMGDSQAIWREVYVNLGAAAMATQRIVLGPGVTNPVTRHVSVTASALATLGELTGGRVALGIGAGDSAVETVGNRPSRLAALETAIRTIRQLVSGEEVELGQGTMRLDWVGSQRIPIIIGASGPKLLRLAGKVADGAKICHCRNRCGMSRSGAAARHVGRASGLDYSPHSESRRSSCHPSYLCARDHECGIGEPGRTDSGGKVGGMWRAAFNPGSANLQHYLLTVRRPFRDLYASSIRSKVTQNARPFY